MVAKSRNECVQPTSKNDFEEKICNGRYVIQPHTESIKIFHLKQMQNEENRGVFKEERRRKLEKQHPAQYFNRRKTKESNRDRKTRKNDVIKNICCFGK